MALFLVSSHVKVFRDQSNCWMETMMMEEGGKPVYINMPAGMRGASWIIMAKAVEKMLEYRAWFITRESHARDNRHLMRYKGTMGKS